MEPIYVPGPPKEAFNKHRPVSDLIKAQIKHLKHLEQKMPADMRASLPQHAIVSENDAARYIAPMTELLRSQSDAAGVTTMVPKTRRAPTPIRSARPLDLAAAAEPEPAEPTSKDPGKKASSRRSGTSVGKGKGHGACSSKKGRK